MNKLFRRASAALVTLALLVCVVPFAAFADTTANGITLQSNAGETLQPGQTFVITLYYTGENVAALSGTLNYDAEVATFGMEDDGDMLYVGELTDDGTSGPIIACDAHAENGVIKYAWVNTDGISGTDVAVMEFYFTANEIADDDEETTKTFEMSAGNPEAYESAVEDESGDIIGVSKVDMPVYEPYVDPETQETIAPTEEQPTVKQEIEKPNYLIGDINGDGKVNATDNTLMLRHIKGSKLLTDAGQLLRADINGDGKINATDNTMMLRHIKGIKSLW